MRRRVRRLQLTQKYAHGLQNNMLYYNILTICSLLKFIYTHSYHFQQLATPTDWF